MLIKTFGSAVFGINAAIITIEADVTRGIKFLLAIVVLAASKQIKSGKPKDMEKNLYISFRKTQDIFIPNCLIKRMY
jgi:hypothetical protein